MQGDRALKRARRLLVLGRLRSRCCPGMLLFVVLDTGVMLLGRLSLVVITAGTGTPSAGRGKGRRGAFALAGQEFDVARNPAGRRSSPVRTAACSLFAAFIFKCSSWSGVSCSRSRPAPRRRAAGVRRGRRPAAGRRECVWGPMKDPSLPRFTIVTAATAAGVRRGQRPAAGRGEPAAGAALHQDPAHHARRQSAQARQALRVRPRRTPIS